MKAIVKTINAKEKLNSHDIMTKEELPLKNSPSMINMQTPTDNNPTETAE